jgi:hypothetical protein
VGLLDLEGEMKILEKIKEKTKSEQQAEDTESKAKKKSLIKKKKVDNSLGDSVTALVVITKIQVLAAGYLNGKIVLWDILQSKIRKTYENLKTVNMI